MIENDTIKDVADLLEISAITVRSHVKQIYAKFGLDTGTRYLS
jgi:DNA-binding CsgD family transcriptional regulator